MFRVDGYKITITKGDTGSLTVQLSGNETPYTASDRALFTIANKSGTEILMQEEYPIENSQFTVNFANDVTDKWKASAGYQWEVRVIRNPTRTEGRISGGTEVITPIEAQQFVVASVLGEV